MKTSLKLFVLVAVIGLFSFSNSFGALMWYVKITGASGKSRIVQIKCPDGSCATTVTGLEAGKNTFSLCNAEGKLMKAKEKANQAKCSCSFTYTSSISAPRDQATGMSTGKRMHKPITVTAEASRAGEIILPGDVDGDSITFQKIEWTWSDGSKTAMDDWAVSK
jgi:hypothetical protein